MLAGIILTWCLYPVWEWWRYSGTVKINLGISFTIFNDNIIHETPYKTQYDHGMLCSEFSIALSTRTQDSGLRTQHSPLWPTSVLKYDLARSTGSGLWSWRHVVSRDRAIRTLRNHRPFARCYNGPHVTIKGWCEGHYCILLCTVANRQKCNSRTYLARRVQLLITSSK